MTRTPSFTARPGNSLSLERAPQVMSAYVTAIGHVAEAVPAPAA